ncbi:MAG TPA: DUF1232 domain-containing protein [Methanothermobacter sp.]|nr:DUF1232 domain-containing protein [Methanothermobacter sp.]
MELAKALKEDERVPRVSKVLLGVALGYFLLPMDLIPDFIPLFGQLDDLIIVPLLVFVAIRFIPKEVFLEHYRKIFNKGSSTLSFKK